MAWVFQAGGVQVAGFKSLIDEQVNNLSIIQFTFFKSVNDTALKYYESEKEKFELLKTGLL